MKRDIDLMRKILLTIEQTYQAGQGNLSNLKIDGYDMPTVAEHCDLLYQQDLIKNYRASYGDDVIQNFAVGNLTAKGYEYLELIRNDRVWEKTKAQIEKEDRPKTVDEIARVAGVFIGNMFKELNS